MNGSDTVYFNFRGNVSGLDDGCPYEEILAYLYTFSGCTALADQSTEQPILTDGHDGIAFNCMLLVFYWLFPFPSLLLQILIQLERDITLL